MSKILERIRAVQRGELPPPPIARLLGIQILAADVGKATVALEVDERLANPTGTLHGGILCDLGDAAMGIAFASTCDDGDSYATIELKCNFLRPVWKSRLSANAWMVYRGKTIGLAECEVLDEQQRLIAKLSSTLTVLRSEAARGRHIGEASPPGAHPSRA